MALPFIPALLAALRGGAAAVGRGAASFGAKAESAVSGLFGGRTAKMADYLSNAGSAMFGGGGSSNGGMQSATASATGVGNNAGGSAVGGGGSGTGMPPPQPLPGPGGAGGGGSGKDMSAFQPSQKSKILDLVSSVTDLKDEGSRLVKDIAGKPFEAASKRIDQGRSIVKNDMTSLVEQMDMLPDGVKKFVRSLDSLTNAITEKGRELAGYDGNLASAGATADVRKIQTDIREAQYLGKSYGRVMDESSKLNSNITDALNPIKDEIAKILGDILETANGVFEYIKEYMWVLVPLLELVRAGVAALTLNFSKALEIIGGIAEATDKARREKQSESEYVKTIFENTLNQMKNMPGQKMEDFRDNGMVFNLPRFN